VGLVKRFVTTVHASLDRTVSSIENHEAVVDAALRESRQAVARAKVRLTRLEKDATQQRNRVAELSSEINLWNERAKSVADEDRSKAMACIQRRRLCEQELCSAREQMTEHARVIKRVRDSISESTNRVGTLQNQKERMRSREAAAHAGQILQSLEGLNGVDVEVSVENAEMHSDNYSTLKSVDKFEESFTNAEEQTLLESELDALLSGAGENGNRHPDGKKDDRGTDNE